jgi:hypothetical protein
MYEYWTTTGAPDGYYIQGIFTDYSDPVKPPEGMGWEMVGSVATTVRLYWFWRRRVD